jgi:hypothetical protein
VESTRSCIGTRTEFSTRVQFGENNLNTRKASFWFNVHWDTSTVIFNGYAAVFLKLNDYFFAVSGKGLIDAVVDYFP